MTGTEQEADEPRPQRTEDQKLAARDNWIQLWMYSVELIGVFLRVVVGLLVAIVEIAFAVISGAVEIMLAVIAGIASLFQ